MMGLSGLAACTSGAYLSLLPSFFMPVTVTSCCTVLAPTTTRIARITARTRRTIFLTRLPFTFFLRASPVSAMLFLGAGTALPVRTQASAASTVGVIA